jgi:hypothetical protein
MKERDFTLNVLDEMSQTFCSDCAETGTSVLARGMQPPMQMSRGMEEHAGGAPREQRVAYEPTSIVESTWSIGVAG